MSVDEIAQACVNAIIRSLPNGKPTVTLILKGKRKTFAGKGSPRGTVLEERKGETILSFDPMDVLGYMIAKKIINPWADES